MIGTLFFCASLVGVTPAPAGATGGELSQSVCASAASDSEAGNNDTIAPRSVRLDEVSVVGVKQNASLLRDAVSGTVLNTRALENQNVTAIKGVSDMVPNLYIPDYGSRITSSIYVRGIGSRMDQPAVGLAVDNVPILNKNGYDFDLDDISSVEVLRGPQSALYGRNTMGGLINVSTLSPMLWQGFRGAVEVGGDNRYRASLGLYATDGKRGASGTVNVRYHKGSFTNEYNGRPVGGEFSGGARIKYHRRASERVYIKNTLSMSAVKQDGYPYESVSTGKISYNDTCAYNRLMLIDGLSVSYRGEGWQMHSISSLQLLADTLKMDQDFLPLPYFTLQQRQQDLGLTQDLFFKGERSVGDDSKYKWLGGAFVFYKQLDMGAPVTFRDEGIKSMIESHRNDMNPYYPIRWDSREFQLNSDFTIPTFGAALYHESKLSAGRWELTAGCRLDYETSKLNYRSHCNTGYTIFEDRGGELTEYRHVPLVIDDRGTLRRSYFNWLPKVSALYNIYTAHVTGNVYGSVAKGYKSGGFNTQMFSDVLKQRLMGIMGVGADYEVDDVVGYKPEHSWNFEIGTHLPFRLIPLQMDATLFYVDCNDQQITMFPSGDATGRITANAGRTRSVGGEFAASWTPLRNLTMNASYGYTDARFVRFFNGKQDFKGNRIPYAPQNTLFLQALMRTSISEVDAWPYYAGDEVVFDVNMRGVGPIYWNEENTLRQNFYPLLGASVTVRKGDISVQLWGENLLNREFSTFYFKSMGNEFLQRGLPVRGGITFRYAIPVGM